MPKFRLISCSRISSSNTAVHSGSPISCQEFASRETVEVICSEVLVGHSPENVVTNFHLRPLSLPRGLSYDQITGRLPVDLDVENSWRFPAEIRISAIFLDPNCLFLQWKPNQPSDYAFSPAANSADF